MIFRSNANVTSGSLAFWMRLSLAHPLILRDLRGNCVSWSECRAHRGPI